MANTVGEETAAGSRERSRHEEIPDAQGEFALSIEERKVDCCAREKTAFDSTEEETACNEATITLHNSCQGCDDAPGDGDESNPAGGAQFFEHEVARNLRQNVCDEEDRDGGLELR